MRRSDAFLTFLCLALALFASSGLDAQLKKATLRGYIAQTRATAASLELTDLCLFSEARYTRHPSQADLHAPFQDHPASLDHFPTGSLLLPALGRY